ncbi:hypothetical protein Bpfe_030632, partial [Biomphalaria pfeifferi]
MGQAWKDHHRRKECILVISVLNIRLAKVDPSYWNVQLDFNPGRINTHWSLLTRQAGCRQDFEAKFRKKLFSLKN